MVGVFLNLKVSNSSPETAVVFYDRVLPSL